MCFFIHTNKTNPSILSPTGSVNARALGLSYFAFSVQTINLIWGFGRTAICLVCKTAVQTSLWLLFCLFRDSMTIAGDDVHQTQSCFFLWFCGRIELQGLNKVIVFSSLDFWAQLSYWLALGVESYCKICSWNFLHILLGYPLDATRPSTQEHAPRRKMTGLAAPGALDCVCQDDLEMIHASYHPLSGWLDDHPPPWGSQTRLSRDKKLSFLEPKSRRNSLRN